MQKFSVILPDEVVEYQRFYFSMKIDNVVRLFSRLIGFKISGEEIYPVYQPIFSYEKEKGDLFFEIHFSKWTSLVININKTGCHWKWFDIRKDHSNG